MTLCKRWSILSKPAVNLLTVHPLLTMRDGVPINILNSLEFCSFHMSRTYLCIWGGRDHDGTKGGTSPMTSLSLFVTHSLSIPTVTHIRAEVSGELHSEISNTYESSSFYTISLIFMLANNVSRCTDGEKKKNTHTHMASSQLCAFMLWRLLGWSHGPGTVSLICVPVSAGSWLPHVGHLWLPVCDRDRVIKVLPHSCTGSDLTDFHTSSSGDLI